MTLGGPPESSPAEDLLVIREVRYSLPMLLQEMQLEHGSGTFAKEILDQIEINRMFEIHRARHAKRRK